jgi:ribosomal protein S18 acetylase RimI-like enzyme
VGVTVRVRPYDPACDGAAVVACMVELQDYERSLEPALPAGVAVADAYLAHLRAKCRAHGGEVLVAEVDGIVVGFVGILTKVAGSAPDDPAEHAYISDLVVRETFRGQGIGRALMDVAESRARAAGAALLRVGVLVRNERAARLYRAAGFRDYTIQLQKEL